MMFLSKNRFFFIAVALVRKIRSENLRCKFCLYLSRLTIYMYGSIKYVLYAIKKIYFKFIVSRYNVSTIYIFLYFLIEER